METDDNTGMQNMEIHVKDNSNATVLWIDHSRNACKLTQTIHVGKDASVAVAYSELMQNDVKLDVTVLLEGEGANANIRTATVARGKLNYEIRCVHQAMHTTGIMNNYGIVLKDANWKLVATGKIEKGHRQSESHQTSRVLTFDKKQTVQVLPILLIDENDVKASHATSLGQPDENQLYYMQSRGLTKNEAIQLLAIGYLLPIADVVDDETLRTRLREEVEEKVQSVCLV